ncbi:MAG: hypothetical protein RLY67_822 [Pseudomonadota bacterium]
MSFALAHARSLLGLRSQVVRVEVHLANGLPQFSLVGLPSTAVRESRDRVRAALVNSGFEFPARRVTVSLTPADLPKDSGHFDLAIALGILAASQQFPLKALENKVFAGELSLSGELLPVRAAFALATALSLEPLGDRPYLVLPRCNANDLLGFEAEQPICLATSLHDLVFALRVGEALTVWSCKKPAPAFFSPDGSSLLEDPDLAEPEAPLWEDLQGQSVARQAAMVAVAGAHNLLMLGPPGVGKSMIAQRMAGLVPPMPNAIAAELAAIRSLATGSPAGIDRSSGRGTERGSSHNGSGFARPPFRNPHHTSTARALTGGGIPIRPGEMSLAHGGILFLDEMPEFSRDCLESLREPLETKQVRISRAKEQVEYPAHFMLVGAMNPCPCGLWGGKACRCSPDQVQRYRGRISGPVLDRFDLAVMLEQNTTQEQNNAATRAHGPSIEGLANGGTSEMVQAVARAREIARARQGCNNADLSIAKLNQMSLIEASAADLVSNMAQRMGWSLRVVHRLLRVARTIADLEGQHQVTPAQMAKAIGLRRGLDRPATS